MKICLSVKNFVLLSVDKPPAKSPRRVYSQIDEKGLPIAGVDELSTVGHPADVQVAHVFEKGG